jgi:UDP-3-O-[3-hydroxymyristoyl] glucosamine N-acyltransferase
MRASSKPLIRVKNPKLAFVLLYHELNRPVPREAFVHPSAQVAGSVRCGENVWIGPQVTIDEHVTIGPGTVIESGAVIKKNCSLGSFCHIHPCVVLYEGTVIRDRVILHGGVVVGADGFGYVKDKEAIYKFPQLGRVIIEDHVEVGANTAIDRGALDDTVIGAHSKIDNLCHIAHNVKIGKNVIMAAMCGVAGGTVIGDNVTMSGHIAVIDNITIGRNAMVGGQSGIIGDVDEGVVVWGSPARPLAQAKKQMAVLSWAARNFPALSRLVKKESASGEG